MSDDLLLFNSKLYDLIQGLKPENLRRAQKEMQEEIYRRNKERLQRQESPDGKQWEPRQSDHWKYRRLKAGERLQPGQKFAYLKWRSVSLKWVRYKDGRYIGEEIKNGDSPQHRAQGFLPKYIRIETSKYDQRMMKNLAKTKWLKRRMQGNMSVIGWFGSGMVDYVASQQHWGDLGKRLPSRMLLGFNPDDLRYMEETLIRYLAEQGGLN